MALLPFIVHLINVPSPTAPPGSDNILLVVSYVMWFAAIAGVVGLVVFGISMFFMHRAGQGFPELGSRLAAIFGGMILIGGAGGIVTTFIHG
ncbi:MAG: hypothetical protein M3N46_05255 [Actinomycetota bacterium]|nr:hypothetical protein [Actinomycetota bacterium]